MGRHKKKRPVVEREIVDTKRHQYKVELMANNYFKAFIGDYKTYKEAYEKVQELILRNNDVLIPVRSTKNHLNNGYRAAKYEYVIIDRMFEDEDNVSMLRNGMGEIVEHRAMDIKSDGYRKVWKVMHKEPCLIEETFRVPGCDVKMTCVEIFDKYIGVDKADNSVTRIMVLHNKVVMDLDGLMWCVVCKNDEDSLRLYNMLKKLTSDKHVKHVYFFGYVPTNIKSQVYSELEANTGWSRSRLMRNK